MPQTTFGPRTKLGQQPFSSLDAKIKAPPNKFKIKDPKTNREFQLDWDYPDPPSDDEIDEILGVEPTKPKMKEPEWYDKAAGFGLRTIPSVIGGVLGGAGGAAAGTAAGIETGPGALITGGAGLIAGTELGSGLGSGLGEGAAQWYEKKRGLRKDYSPSEMALQAAVGTIPFAGKIPGAGSGLGKVLGYGAKHAVQGAALGASSTAASHYLETGELPEVSQVGEGALWGGALSGLTAGALGKYNSRVRPVKGAIPENKIVPDVEQPTGVGRGLIDDVEHNNIINKAVNPFKSDPLPPIDALPKNNKDPFFLDSKTVRDPNIPEIENPFKPKRTTEPDSIGVRAKDVPSYDAAGYHVEDAYPDGSFLMTKGKKVLPAQKPFKPNDSHVSPFIGPFEDFDGKSNIPPISGEPHRLPSAPKLPPVEPINTLPIGANDAQRQGYYKAVEDFRKSKLPPPITPNIPDSVAFAPPIEQVEPIRRPELPIAPKQELPVAPIQAPKRPELPPIEPVKPEQLPPNATDQQRQDYYKRIENFRNPPVVEPVKEPTIESELQGPELLHQHIDELPPNATNKQIEDYYKGFENLRKSFAKPVELPTVEPIGQSPIKRQAVFTRDPKEIHQRFKDNFYKVDSPNNANFIMPDGTTLKTSGKEHAVSANNIGTYLDDAMKSGIIRVAGQESVEVSSNITNAQAKTIHDMIAGNPHGNPVIVETFKYDNSDIPRTHREFDERATPGAIKEWVNSHFKEELSIKKQEDIAPTDPNYAKTVAEYKAVQHMYENLSSPPISGTKHKPIFHDPGDRLTISERKWMESHPVIHDFTRFYSNMIHDITEAMGRPDLADAIEGVGIILDPTSHGIHITNQKNGKGSIGFNPFININKKTPTEASRAIVTTAKHETAHVDVGVKPQQQFAFSISDQMDPRFKGFVEDLMGQIEHAQKVGGEESGHGLDFVYRLGEIYGQYGIKRTSKAAKRIEQILTKGNKGSGGYGPKLQDVLYVYNESRGRKATTPDILTRKGVKQTDTGTRKDSIPSNNKANGKGTSVNEKEAAWKLMADEQAKKAAKRLERFGVSGSKGNVPPSISGNKGNVPPPPANPPSNPPNNSGTPKPNPITLAGKAKSAYKNATEGLYKGVYEPIATSVKTRIEKLGPGGRDLAEELANERTESARYGGEHYLKTRNVMRELSKNEQAEVVSLLKGTTTSSNNPKVTKAATTLENSIEKLRKEAEKAKVQIKDANGKWVDWERGVNEKLPNYDKGLKGVGAYQHEVARDVIRAERFGNLADETSTIRHLINMTDDSKEARLLVDHLFNRTKTNIGEETLAAQNKWYNKATKLQVATKLSQFGITNLGDLASISGNLGIRNTAKAILDVISDKHGSADIGVKSGAHAILQKAMLHDIGIGKLTGKWYGADATEKFTRTVGALAGRAETQRLFKLAKKDSKYSKQLSRFLDDDVADVLKQSKLTDQQLDFAGGRGVELSSGVPDKLTLSKAFHADNPLLRLPLLFKRFAFVNSKNIIDSIKAEPTKSAKLIKAGKLLAMYGLAGEVTGDAKALLKSIGSDKSAGEELEDRNHKYDVNNPILNRLMANYLQSALLGIPGDISESVSSRKMGKFSGAVGGPIGSDIDEALQGLGDVIEPPKTGSRFGKLGKSTVKRIPYIGAGLADRFNKEEDTKSGLRKFDYSKWNN